MGYDRLSLRQARDTLKGVLLRCVHLSNIRGTHTYSRRINFCTIQHCHASILCFPSQSLLIAKTIGNSSVSCVMINTIRKLCSNDKLHILQTIWLSSSVDDRNNKITICHCQCTVPSSRLKSVENKTLRRQQLLLYKVIDVNT